MKGKRSIPPPTRMALPASPGAYVLVIELAKPVRLPIARLGTPVLPVGLYAYCGSARGPGGLKARVGRHLRREKPLRWHVDHLTTKGRVVAVGTSATLSECELRSRLAGGDGSGVPVRGFGATDCRICPAHLLSLDSVPNLTALGLDTADPQAF